MSTSDERVLPRLGSYPVNEIFESIQGEGYHAGRWAAFIRLQGCPVNCEWCDTKYASGTGGEMLLAEEIAKRVKGPRFVVITGGEPLMYNLDRLFLALRDAGASGGRSIQVETSGFRPYKGQWRPDWTTWSPKPTLAWEADTLLKREVNEVKWVVDDNLTINTVLRHWEWFVHSRTALYDRKPIFTLMPEGVPPKPDMIARALTMLSSMRLSPDSEFWRYSDRLHTRAGVK